MKKFPGRNVSAHRGAAPLRAEQEVLERRTAARSAAGPEVEVYAPGAPSAPGRAVQGGLGTNASPERPERPGGGHKALRSLILDELSPEPAACEVPLSFDVVPPKQACREQEAFSVSDEGLCLPSLSLPDEQAAAARSRALGEGQDALSPAGLYARLALLHAGYRNMETRLRKRGHGLLSVCFRQSFPEMLLAQMEAVAACGGTESWGLRHAVVLLPPDGLGAPEEPEACLQWMLAEEAHLMSLYLPALLEDEGDGRLKSLARGLLSACSLRRLFLEACLARLQQESLYLLPGVGIWLCSCCGRLAKGQSAPEQCSLCGADRGMHMEARCFAPWLVDIQGLQPAGELVP